MTFKITQALALCVFLIMGQAFAESVDCVLPVADGGVENPSPPSIQGIIGSIGSNQITLIGKEEPILLSTETQLFTVYGGIVFAREIKKGQHVLVWFVGCDASPNKVAAVIQFCSKGNEPCPE